uniref:Uncharacterized protein n=1 Tax=Rhizophagus irregularis (strain DAOM 181602 / DAOM 197198 / MUCL 43194) TaxID=747089 RepID=U9T9A5_RHIID
MKFIVKVNMITNKSTVFDILTGIYEKKQKIMLYYYGRDTANLHFFNAFSTRLGIAHISEFFAAICDHISVIILKYRPVRKDWKIIINITIAINNEVESDKQISDCHKNDLSILNVKSEKTSSVNLLILIMIQISYYTTALRIKKQINKLKELLKVFAKLIKQPHVTNNEVKIS